MIASVDESVGRIVETLDELGLAENTLVIFSSDNGGVGGYQSAGLRTRTASRTTRRSRAARACCTKAASACRTSFAGRARFSRAGRMPRRLFPSICIRRWSSWRATKPPNDYPLDGVSYASLLTGAATVARSRRHLLAFSRLFGSGGQTVAHDAGGRGAIRRLEADRVLRGSRQELYNLKDDVGERRKTWPSVSPRKPRNCTINWLPGERRSVLRCQPPIPPSSSIPAVNGRLPNGC